MYMRTGTLWEGRHKASLVQQEKYFFTCSRYIELNPVVAKMVLRPEEYKWSSYVSNAWGENSWIAPHEEYLNLVICESERCENYREMFRYELDIDDIHMIRKSTYYSHPLGDDRFKVEIEKKYGITPGQTKSGRPRKDEE